MLLLAHEIICAIVCADSSETCMLWVRAKQARSVYGVNSLQCVRRNAFFYPLDQCLERSRGISTNASFAMRNARRFKNPIEVMNIRLNGRYLIVVQTSTAECNDLISLQTCQLCNTGIMKDSRDRDTSASFLRTI